MFQIWRCISIASAMLPLLLFLEKTYNYLHKCRRIRHQRKIALVLHTCTCLLDKYFLINMIRLLKVYLTAELSVVCYINIYLKKRKKSPVQFCEIVHRKKCHSTINVKASRENAPKQQESFVFCFSEILQPHTVL